MTKYALSQKKRVTLYERTQNDNSIVYTFIRNLGHADLERAKRDFPEAEVNLSLRGRVVELPLTVSNTTENKEVSDDIKFSMGPYINQPISECTDQHFLVYCLSMNFLTDDEYQACKKRALEIGCVTLGEKSWWTKKDTETLMYKRALDNYKKKSEIASVFSEGKQVSIDIDSNVSLSGEYTNSTKYGSVVFKFPVVHYEANSHAPDHSYIKDLKTQKGKRTKGKQVFLKKYTFDGKTVTCEDYEIV